MPPTPTVPAPLRPLVLLLAAGCLGPVGPQRRAAAPHAGSPDDQAAPGQSACAAATRAWPESPSLDRRIRAAMERGRLPAVGACVVKDGDIAWCGAYGRTAVDGGQPVTTDTPFLWASVSKLVTATAAVVADERGMLDLDQDVAEVWGLPIVHPDHPDTPIRTRQLLAHVGGIDDNDAAMDGYEDDNRPPALSLDALVPRYFVAGGADHSPRRNFTGAAPGRRFRYSNMGSALAGATVGAAVGQPFDAHVEAVLFDALGMDHSAWNLGRAPHDTLPLDTLAEPHSWRGGAWVANGHATYADYPNGGLRSSVHDMACFLAMAARGGTLYGTRILETDTLHAMMAPAYPAADRDQALGWAYTDLGDRQLWIGHDGAEDGVASELYLTQDGRLGFVLVASGDWRNEQAMLDIEDAVVAFGRRL